MKNNHPGSSQKSSPILWIFAGFLLVGMLFSVTLFPELMWLSVVVGVLLLAVLGTLIYQNKKALKTRTAAFGLNSAITIVLVICIVGVLNFIVSRYPLKWDLTKNKAHTLSDQTVKLVKELKKPVKATLFSKIAQKEQYRPLLDNYKGLNPKFEVEYVDPDKEPTRARQIGFKKYGTLLLTVGNRENKIEDVSEEKITNALIKLLKEKSPTLCAVSGHGEKNFNSNEAEGFEAMKRGLTDQAYEIKDLNLLQEGKVPESCDTIAILGPTKAFFEPEVKALREYLNQGGRAIIALDINLKGAETSPEILSILESWNVRPLKALIVDPVSRLLGVDASVAVLANYSKDNPITKDFQENCAFPFTRPLEIIPGAPEGLTVQWLAQTTPKSWAVMDLSQLSKGAVSFQAGKDKQGPLNAAIAVEGKQKDSQAKQKTRLVVFGSSHFANNNYSRFGGNMDFFLNSVSWTLEDESLISIRSKEEGPGKVELSQKTGTFIFLLTVILIPIATAVGGLGIWIYRRRL